SAGRCHVQYFSLIHTNLWTLWMNTVQAELSPGQLLRLLNKPPGSTREEWYVHRKSLFGLVSLATATMLTLTACGGESGAGGATASSGGDTVKVGILHSLSGTMAISEVTVKNAELLAIEEVNAAGGVLGKRLEPVIEDGASDWPTFAEKAQKLIRGDKVATVFGLFEVKRG